MKRARMLFVGALYSVMSVVLLAGCAGKAGRVDSRLPLW